MYKIFRSLLLMLVGCVACDLLELDFSNKTDDKEQLHPSDEGNIDNGGSSKPDVDGVAYMWDESVIPEITVKITEDEWNNLLFRYDEFEQNVDYFHADFVYKKGKEITEIKDGGLRLRGNTSRRRPEGNYGEKHDSNNPDWHHCHFGINFTSILDILITWKE